MALSPDLLISLWDRAKEAEIGIAITVEGSVSSLSTQLHGVRKQLNEPELRQITVIMPEGGTQVWLVKKETELDD
jgi:hypothetical protein